MEVRRLGGALLRSQECISTLLQASTTSRCARATETMQRVRLQRYSVSAALQAARPQASSPSKSSSLSSDGNSASDLLKTLNAYNTASQSGASSTPFDINLMATPKKSPSATNTAPSSLPYSASSIMNSISRDLTSPPPARPALRLNPTTGRTVSVGGNVDVGRAFRLLETSCARNKVRTEFNYQRFHERPGLKRKRLHSKRWRVRFMEGFRATVGRVKHLKSQGW